MSVMATNSYSGMTVNERLYAGGLLDAFDAAVESGDKAEVVRVLQRVELSLPEAQSIADAIFADPGRYGYPRSPQFR
jgi:hypothetical protein